VLRVVVAVLLAVAVLGTSLPAVDAARVEAADTHLHGELTAVRTAVADLLVRDDPASGPGARRVVTVDVPGRSWGHAETERVALGGGVLAWRVDGGRRHTLRAPGRLRVADGSAVLVLRRPGQHRLTLALARDERGPVVTVHHTFKPENGTSATHARTAR